MAAHKRLSRAGFALLLAALLSGEQLESEESGGWWSSSDFRLNDEGRCNIQVLEQVSYRDFIQRYAYSRPVILRGLTDNTRFRRLCSKQRLLEEFGEGTVRLSTANTFSYRKGTPWNPSKTRLGPQTDQYKPVKKKLKEHEIDVSFREYVDVLLKPQPPDALGNDTLYLFGDNNLTEWQALFAEYRPPPLALPHTSGAYSFGVAGAGTGVPFHWHGPGFSEVIYGRKRWFLYPPDKQPHFHPNHSTLSWVRETYPSLPEEEAPLECTIRPGELLYFPDRWWHATLNLDTSVFISTFLG